MSKETIEATLREYAEAVSAEDIGPDCVRTRVGPGTIELEASARGDQYATPSHDRYSMRAAYTSLDGFGFKVGRKMPFHSLRGRIFGGKDIDIGHPELQREHFVIANDEGKVRELFSRRKLRDAFLRAGPPATFFGFRTEHAPPGGRSRQVKMSRSPAEKLEALAPQPYAVKTSWSFSRDTWKEPQAFPRTARLVHDFLEECLLALEEIGSAAPAE